MSDKKSNNPGLLNNLDALLNPGKCTSDTDKKVHSTNNDESDNTDKNTLDSNIKKAKKNTHVLTPHQQNSLFEQTASEDYPLDNQKTQDTANDDVQDIENPQAKDTTHIDKIIADSDKEIIETTPTEKKNKESAPIKAEKPVPIIDKKTISVSITKAQIKSKPEEKSQAESKILTNKSTNAAAEKPFTEKSSNSNNNSLKQSSVQKKTPSPSPFFSNPFDIIPDNVPLLDTPLQYHEIDQAVKSLLNNPKKSIDDYAHEIELKLRDIAPSLSPKQRYLIINELIFVIDKIGK